MFQLTMLTMLTMAHLFVLQKKDLKAVKKEAKLEEKEVRPRGGFLAGLFPEDYYFPPVDFMTAQVRLHVFKVASKVQYKQEMCEVY